MSKKEKAFITMNIKLYENETPIVANEDDNLEPPIDPNDENTQIDNQEKR